ncbi:hypothetical protein IJN73_00125 [Candidatus Saccharibacteria bacterium]|nr:hypothetical protein [Candidatus Saccharibacteria bacterium]
MIILEQPVKKADLKKLCQIVFDDVMIKGAVDVRKGLLGLDAELHADIEQELLAQGSKQEDIWGINLYPDEEGEDFVEFDSMVNVRPRQNNRSRYVEDAKTRKQIIEVVDQWVQ